MKKIVLATAAAAALMTLSAIGAARAAPVYMETGDKTFGTIDLSTGAYTNIGSSSYLGTPIQLSGLGASGGDIYGGAYLGTALYEVDTATGALSLIGNSTENYELTGSTATGLYEFGADGNLYSINPANGAATLVGATGITLGTWDGMSSGGSQLYVSSGTNLYLINTSTGAGTFIGSISPAEFGAMVNVGGTWWGGNDLGPAQLYTFDPSTAAVIPKVIAADRCGPSRAFRGR
jgi:hypothetical protein